MNKQVCLITGASRGLGVLLAVQLRNRGYHVVAVARDAQRLQQARDEGLIDDYLSCDLSSATQIDECLQQFENRYQRLDLLIHNAAMQCQYAVLDDCHYANILSREHQVNFLAPVKLTQALLPMLLHHSGRIMAISSVLQFGAKRSAPGYCSSKAALSNWLNNLRAQLSGTGVQVTEVIPGLMATDMQLDEAGKGVDPALIAVEIADKLHCDRVITRGARLAWWLYCTRPRLLQRMLLRE